MTHMLVHLVILLLIVGGICWLVSLTPIPAVIKNVIFGVVVLVRVVDGVVSVFKREDVAH